MNISESLSAPARHITSEDGGRFSLTRTLSRDFHRDQSASLKRRDSFARLVSVARAIKSISTSIAALLHKQ